MTTSYTSPDKLNAEMKGIHMSSMGVTLSELDFRNEPKPDVAAANKQEASQVQNYLIQVSMSEKMKGAEKTLSFEMALRMSPGVAQMRSVSSANR